MVEEQKTEVDMDVFSRRISPYFTWLESRIESGWKQSESCRKSVLKETRALATSMRAKFILGMNKEEFSKELERSIELFELALDAFPDYANEVENKIFHFTKGIKTELGDDVLPAQGLKFANGEALKREEPKVFPKLRIIKADIKLPEVDEIKKQTKAVKKPKIEAVKKPKIVKKPAKKVLKKIEKKLPHKREEFIKKEEVFKPVEQFVEKIEKKAGKVEAKPVQEKPAEKKSGPKKPNAVFKWFKGIIWGDD